MQEIPGVLKWVRAPLLSGLEVRAREVALQCAVAFYGPYPDVTASAIVADAADVFLPFLLGEDKEGA